MYYEHNPEDRGSVIKHFFTSAGVVAGKRLYITALEKAGTVQHVVVFEFAPNHRMRIAEILNLEIDGGQPMHIGSLEVSPDETELTVFNTQSGKLAMFKL